MSDTAFRLARTIGRSYSVDPEDTRRIKVALKDLGYFETPSYGLTPYPDEKMFRGIEQFQEDFGLRRDGVVKPDGETATKMAEVLAGREGSSKPSVQDPMQADPFQASRRSPSSAAQDSRPGGSGEGAQGRQLAFAPAVPVIVQEIAVFFGMSVAAAYAWWLSLSEGAKKEVRSQVEAHAPQWRREESPSEEDCEELNRIDTRTCKQIAKRRGPRAGARCHASASERYSACLNGRPREGWPPLDTWNQ